MLYFGNDNQRTFFSPALVGLWAHFSFVTDRTLDEFQLDQNVKLRYCLNVTLAWNPTHDANERRNYRRKNLKNVQIFSCIQIGSRFALNFLRNRGKPRKPLPNKFISLQSQNVVVKIVRKLLKPFFHSSQNVNLDIT